MRRLFFLISVVYILVDIGISSSYASEVGKKPHKYLRYLKTRSSSMSTPRYLQSSAAFQDSSFGASNSPYISPRQEVGGTSSLGGYTGPMMTSASERSPSRIIIVRQPSYSSKRHHSSSTSSYGSQYMPQASSMAPSVAYPYAQPYGYGGHQYMSGYNYQTPMTGSPYGSQMASYPPLVASMIAAAQRVTQNHGGAYGNQYAGTQVSPQYYPPYGMPPMQSPMYGGYGYQG